MSPTTVTRLVVPAEIGSRERSTRVVEISEVELDDDFVEMHVGQHVELLDETGQYWSAAVESISRDKLGKRYFLRLPV